MPSGLPDAVVDAVLDQLVGAGQDSTLLPATLYLDLLTTAPTDDNGTGAVSWGQGRTAVDMTDASIWAGAADRATVSTPILLPTNSSGDTITVVAFAWYTASSGGTYKGGGPVPGGTLDIDDSGAITLVVTLASPSPSS